MLQVFLFLILTAELRFCQLATRVLRITSKTIGKASNQKAQGGS
jgi:hypothetical protein